MAKKASSVPAQAKSTPAKSAPKGADSPKSTNGKPAAKPAKATKAAAPALSHDLIGLAAGQIWQTLSEKGPQPVAGLKKAVDQPADVVIAALGWLAREDKLDFETSGKSATVSLK